MISPGLPAGRPSGQRKSAWTTIDFVQQTFCFELDTLKHRLFLRYCSKVSLRVLGCEHHSFLGGHTGQEKVNLDTLFQSVSDEMSFFVSKSFSCFSSKCFPKNHFAIHGHNCLCPLERAAVYICLSFNAFH